MELVLKLANVTLDIDRCLILILKTHLCTLLKRTILPKKVSLTENVQVRPRTVYRVGKWV